MKTLLDFLSSVKLAIFLIIFITVASIFGTLIPQGRTLAEYTSMYGQLAPLFTRLELTTLYQSWWYVASLALFALNILVCTLTRLSPKLKKAFSPSLDAEPGRLKTLKVNDSFQRKEPAAAALGSVEKALAARRYKVTSRTEDKCSVLVAQKRRLGLFGSDIVHLGLLVIIAGGIISGMTSFRTTLTISEGETQIVPTADFQLRLDKFDILYYETGAIKDWKSLLTVVDNGQDVLSKTIEVNHPLSHKGIVFYQSSYGWDWENPSLEIWIKKKSDPDFLHKTTLKVGEKASLPDGSAEFTALQFVPDFIIGENRQVQTRSLNPNNPAVYIEGTKDGQSLFSGWVFALYPDISQVHSGEGEAPDLTFEFKDFSAGQYSGIQMARDPGANWIWLGCGLLMLGLFVAFYWPPRELKAVLSEEDGITEITAGGTAAKNKEDFQKEFESIMTTLRRTS